MDGFKSEDIDAMYEKALELFGTIDITENNAEIMDGMEPVGAITDERWDKIFEVNTKGVKCSMRKAVNYWLENDQKGLSLTRSLQEYRTGRMPARY
ncbi:MAG: SDR family NAD(P)-dependent oxidoreductase [Alkalibacterium sp.]|uniref:SDR family NAD(P)-dependent oxidoreductase n=1 Tax=Alkalibacterium sp. TaxID=1872447 RepID=UPI003970BEA1